MMKYSIIIPTYNNRRYLVECLDSIVTSFNGLDFEILLGIDNCDDTLKLMAYFRSINKLSVFYAGSNVGPYVIKNNLTRLANGSNFIFFDSDDIMLPNLGQLYESNYSDYIRFKFTNFRDKGGKMIMLPSGLSFAEGVFGISRDYFQKLQCFHSWRCAADSELYIRASENGMSYKILPEEVFHRRLHDSNLTVSNDTNCHSSLRQSYIEIINRRSPINPDFVEVDLKKL